MAVDGAIIIDAEINLEQAEKGLKELEKSVEKSSENIEEDLKRIHIDSEGLNVRVATKELKELEKQYESLVEQAEKYKELLRDAQSVENPDTGFVEVLTEKYEEASKAVDRTAEDILALEDVLKRVNSQTDETVNSTEQLNTANQTAQQSVSAHTTATQQLTNEQRNAQRQQELLQAAVVNYISQGINAAIGALEGLVSSTFSYRQEMGMLEANLVQAGVSIDTATEYMSRFGAVSSNTSQNLSAVSSLLQTGFTGNNLEQAIDAVSGAVIAFPNQNVEQIAADIQRTFSQGEAVRSFADLIRNTGGDVQVFNSQLAAATSEAQRQQVILNELSRQGLTDVLNSYKQLNPELVNATQAQSDLNQAMARIAEEFQPAQNAIDEFLASLAGFGATILETVPGLSEFIYIVTQLGRVALTLVAGYTILTKVFSGLPALFSSTTSAATSTASALSSAGSAAQGANLGFLSIAAGILLIAGAVSLILVSLTGLAQVFATSEVGALELAASLSIVVLAVSAAIAIIAAVAKAAGSAIPELVAFGAVIAVIALSVAALVDSITNLIKAINGIPTDVNISMNTSTNNTGGYAHGTASARKGLNWVDETTNPRLLYFNGGETVLTNAQTTAQMNARLGTNGQNTNIYNIGGISLNASTVKSFMDVINVIQNEANSYKQGYVGEY